MCTSAVYDGSDLQQYLYYSLTHADLYYILFELLKNSLRAVTELHHEQLKQPMPPVNVIIAHSKESEDVAIKVGLVVSSLPCEHTLFC